MSWTGTDRFTFAACDGTLSSRVATVTLIVRGNTPPVAFDLRGTVEPGSNLTLTAKYQDPDSGQTRTAFIVTPPAHGQAGVQSSLTLLHTPDIGFTGEGTFTYKVNDGADDSNAARCRIKVRPANQRAGNLVVVVAQTNLYGVVSNEVRRLMADLTNEGYAAALKIWPSSGTTPSNLWTYLKSQYDATNLWLEGAILIGNLPKPQVLVTAPSTYYYTDLVYWNMDAFQTDGSVTTYNIWASRFYVHNATYGDEATLIRRALDNNHDYRTGRSRLPHTAYFYHSWQSYADWLYYGRELLDVWPQLSATNEPSTDGHMATKEFFPARADISEAGADALVGGGEIYQETSHGAADCYMNGAFVTADLHRLGSQLRFCLIESCTVGAYGGIVNNHILTRLGGTIWGVGGSDINYVGDFQLAETDTSNAGKVRRRLAAGDSWGAALLAGHPFYAQNRTIYYADLSTGAMASPSNAMPADQGL